MKTTALAIETSMAGAVVVVQTNLLFFLESFSCFSCGCLPSLAPVTPAVYHLPISVNADDLAIVRAAAAIDLPGNEFHIFHIEAEFLPLLAAAGKDCSSDGTHEVSVVVHQHRTAQLVLKGFYDTDILGNPSLEHYWRHNLLAFSHIVQIVPHNSLAEACHNIFLCVANLDFVDQIRLGKYGAPGSYLGWRITKGERATRN